VLSIIKYTYKGVLRALYHTHIIKCQTNITLEETKGLNEGYLAEVNIVLRIDLINGDFSNLL